MHTVRSNDSTMTGMLNWLQVWSGRHPRLRVAAARIHNFLAANRMTIAGGGHRVSCEGAFLRGVRMDVSGTGHTIRIAPGASLWNLDIRIRGDGHCLAIASDVLFKAGSLCMEDAGGRLEIGADTTVEEAHIAVTEPCRSIRIGRDCMLAFGVDIRCGDSHAILDATTGERINPAADISIGDHVWLGAHVQVLKGVTIGSGSVIGVRSVVTRDVPSDAVACGVPAEVSRRGVRWTRGR